MTDWKRDELYRMVDGGMTVGAASKQLNILKEQARQYITERAYKGIASRAKRIEVPEQEDNSPRILILDIETLPNRGFFFDTFSKIPIPLQFIEQSKSIFCIGFKWLGDDETTVLVCERPYDDRKPLVQLSKVWSEAHYVVMHNGDAFDMPFISARLMANGLPSLPPTTTVDTCKLARAKFRRSLNSNKLDHLASVLGIENKNKTDATLWVRCANGDIQAGMEMVEYNRKDVEILEQVFVKILPYVQSKVNCNLFIDDRINRCNHCGSDAIELKGFHLAMRTIRHRFHCGDCGSWSVFPVKKK